VTPWSWWAGSPGEPIYDIAGDEPTREAAIRAACRELNDGDTFRIVEARCSTAARKWDDEGPDPFLRERNHETLTVGPALSAITPEDHQ
jgi:hypothetical protein